MTLTRRKIAGYGWVRDHPDPRDVHLSLDPELVAPPAVDLRQTGHLPTEPYDQGQLGSCTANAIAGAVRYEAARQGLKDVPPSRLWLYLKEREIEGTADSDSGAQIRDGLKVVSRLGWPDESEWPYDIVRFADTPPAKVDADARKDRVTRYYRVPVSPVPMKRALAAGFPIVVGFTVFESFESDHVAATGDVPMPGPDEAILGAHAVIAVGYDDGARRWICRNSWGSWGADSFFTLPYGYLDSPSFAGDFWVCQQEVEAG